MYCASFDVRPVLACSDFSMSATASYDDMWYEKDILKREVKDYVSNCESLLVGCEFLCGWCCCQPHALKK